MRKKITIKQIFLLFVVNVDKNTLIHFFLFVVVSQTQIKKLTSLNSLVFAFQLLFQYPVSQSQPAPYYVGGHMGGMDSMTGAEPSQQQQQPHPPPPPPMTPAPPPSTSSCSAGPSPSSQGSETSFDCTHCGKSLRSRKNYSKHMFIHSGKKHRSRHKVSFLFISKFLFFIHFLLFLFILWMTFILNFISYCLNLSGHLHEYGIHWICSHTCVVSPAFTRRQRIHWIRDAWAEKLCFFFFF